MTSTSGGEQAAALEILITQARRVLPVPREAAEAYGAAREALSAQVNAALAARPECALLLGGNPVEVMETNHANHAGFMSSVFALSQPELLARTLPWVYRAYRGKGFSYDYFPVELEAWGQAIGRCLAAPEAAPILAVYAWMQASHPAIVALAERPAAPAPEEAGDGRWAGASRRYLAALLEGDAAAAAAVAREHSGPEALEGFYVSVLQPAMYAVGEGWEAGRISVAQEHLASAITTRVIAGLASQQKVPRPWRGRVVVTASPNEFHELGAWMISDLLELDGWAVSYLGANTPLEELVQLTRDRRPALVALSVTMPFNLERVRATITRVKGALAPSGVPFLVGGRVFNQQPGLWRDVGADAWAADAGAAVLEARAFGAAGGPRG